MESSEIKTLYNVFRGEKKEEVESKTFFVSFYVRSLQSLKNVLEVFQIAATTTATAASAYAAYTLGKHHSASFFLFLRQSSLLNPL